MTLGSSGARSSRPTPRSVQEAVELFRRDHLSRLAEPLSAILEASGCKYLALAGKALLQRAGPREKRLFEILSQEPEDWDRTEGCGEQ